MNSQIDPLIGEEVDGYLIEQLLGKGGMARVYRGQDVRLRRFVAIKVIEPKARTKPEYTSRFEREARAVAQLQHPHIVSVYRFGEYDGLYYMAMQYIDGSDLGWVLRDFAREGDLMQHEDVLRVVSQVGGALDYAHSRGVIHRDVKPSNVMLNRDGEAILTDFGLALVRAEGTRGEIFGTPQYIAPEQAVNSAGVVPESDQYALGVILYEMLTGGIPFDGKSPMDIAMAHMSEPIPSPLDRNPDLNPAFVPILERVLQKDPADRYPSCTALAADVERVIHAQEQLPSTLSRISMLGVSEQVQQFRAQHPLPELMPAAPVVESTPTDAARTKEVVTPATVLSRRPPNQRRLWIYVAFACCIVAIAGVVAVLALLASSRSLSSNTPTAAVAVITPNFSLETPSLEQSQTDANTISPDVPTALPTAYYLVTPYTILSVPTLSFPTVVPVVATAVPIATVTMFASATPVTVVPTSTPVVYTLTIATHREDSLFVMNSSQSEFPLAPLRVGDDSNAINGSDWGIERLGSGACVAAWKDSGNPKSPDLDCDPIGTRITRSGKDRFWKSSFNVYYNDVQVGTCRGDNCTITIRP